MHIEISPLVGSVRFITMHMSYVGRTDRISTAETQCYIGFMGGCQTES